MKKQTLATFALIFLLLFGGVRTTEAAFVDPMQFLKEFGTDTIAWFLGGLMTGELTRSTADWVNTGFSAVSRSIEINPTTGEPYVANITAPDGETTFVVNPSEFFRNLSVDSAATFFDQLANASSDPSQALNTIFPGFRDDLLREIARETQGMSGSFFDNFESDIQEAELDAYLNDFTSGGWDVFLRTTQKCANNYSCARIAVLSELDSRVAQATAEKQTELEQGGGFLTIRQCADDPIPLEGCSRYINVTPGQLIGEQITKATTVEFERYSEMDEITEVLVTLLEQALNTLIDQGLSSLANSFNSRDLDGEYDALDTQIQEEIRAIEEQAGEIDGGAETDPTPTTGTSCATVTGGNLCTVSTDVDLTADFSGASERFSVFYSGTDTFESDIEYDFGEFTDNVTVVTNSENGGDTGALTNGDTVEVVIRVLDPSLIEDFNDFEGVITIGDLDITVRGIDRR